MVIIPADNKWSTHAVVADVIIEKLKSLKLSYTVVSEEQHLLDAKELLQADLRKRCPDHERGYSDTSPALKRLLALGLGDSKGVREYQSELPSR